MLKGQHESQAFLYPSNELLSAVDDHHLVLLLRLGAQRVKFFFPTPVYSSDLYVVITGIRPNTDKHNPTSYFNVVNMGTLSLYILDIGFYPKALGRILSSIISKIIKKSFVLNCFQTVPSA